MVRILFTLIIALMMCQSLGATTYYVSKSGSNSNNGTSWGTAWATLNKVNNAMSGGDTVYFGTGVYRGNLFPVSGSSGDRTTYACSAFVEGIAEIWGSSEMTTWTQNAGNVYYSDDYTGMSAIPFGGSGNNVLWIVGQLDGNYDTVMTRRTNTNLSEGQFYLNGSGRLYVYRFGGGDPTSSQIEPSTGPPVFYSLGQDYTTIWGFKLRYGNSGGVYMDNAQGYPHNYNHFEHLNIDWIGYGYGVNSGGFQANRGGNGNNAASASHYNVIRACSTFNVIEFNGGTHEAGIGLYTMWHTLVESCYVSTSNWGIIDKEQGHYNTIRYNVCENNGRNEGAAIRVTNAASNDSIYGNIIIGNGIEPVYGIWLVGMTDGFSNRTDSFFVGNNTIFKTYGAGLATVNYGSGNWSSPNWCKYNITDSIASTSGGDYGLVALFKNGDDAAWTEIDSNMYYGSSLNFAGDLGNRSWSQWRSNYGFDEHSTINVDPGFADPSAGDFSRPDASNEMNLTYGGKTWTIFGAVQPAGPQAPDTIAPVILFVSSDTITSTSAVITWATNELANSRAEYGLSASYGSTTTLSPALVYSHSVTLSGLNPTTTYHFRVLSSDGSGNQTASSDYTFTTDAPDNTPPVISNISTSNVSNSTAMITWSTDELANSQVEYGLNAGYGSTTALDPSLELGHNVQLIGLDSITTYHYRVISSDASGNQAISQDYSFTTDSVQSSVNLAEGITPTVSSSFAGFSPTVLTDANLDPNGGDATTWASDESAVSNHWVEVDFGQPVALGQVMVYWAYNSVMSAWMTSQDYRIQSWNGSGWDLVTDVIGTSEDSMTVTDFSIVNTSRIRVNQSVNGGPQGYETVMWMSELELLSPDTEVPASVNDLREGDGQ